MGIFKKIVITLATSSVFTVLGIKLEKRVDKALKFREAKDVVDDEGLKSPEIKDISGGSKINWVSLLKKHKNKIPLITLLLGAVTGSSIAFFEKQIYQYLLLRAPETLNPPQVNKNYFGAKAIDSSKDILQVREFAELIETFSLSPNLNQTEKVDGYKSIIVYFLEFDDKAKLVSVILGFTSLLAYYFSTGNLFLFGQMIVALISLIKEGKISTVVARMIVNGLRQKGVVVPEELEELIK
jgi:hypothetical protein